MKVKIDSSAYYLPEKKEYDSDLLKVISKEYSKFNITSNVISLGTFDTGLFQDLSEKKRKEILESIPSKNAGSINNIVNAVDFIIKSDYVNGSIISIDGGM